MNQQKKWLDFGFGLIALVAWFLIREVLHFGWMQFRLPAIEYFSIHLVDIVAFILALGVFISLKKNGRVSGFGLEVIQELEKVTWPTQQETLLSTGLIVVMVALVSLIFFIFDFFWGWIVSNIL